MRPWRPGFCWQGNKWKTGLRGNGGGRLPGQESDADDTGKRGTMQSLGKHQSLISPALQFSPEISLSRPKVTKLDKRDLAASSITNSRELWSIKSSESQSWGHWAVIYGECQYIFWWRIFFQLRIDLDLWTSPSSQQPTELQQTVRRWLERRPSREPCLRYFQDKMVNFKIKWYFVWYNR